MIFDHYGFLNSEKDPVGDPGRLGDSCANTFRWLQLAKYVGPKPDQPNVAMQSHVRELYEWLKTNKGYVRHPESIWREDDFVGDQAKPLLMGLDAWGLWQEAQEVAKFHAFRYGNGDLVHPTFKASAARASGWPSWFWDISIYVQIVTMQKIPFRWNDEYFKQGRWPFERSEESSADWLNWFHMIIHAEMKGHTYWTRKAKAYASPREIASRITSYFSPEPNSEWLLELYLKAIIKAYL